MPNEHATVRAKRKALTDAAASMGGGALPSASAMATARADLVAAIQAVPLPAPVAFDPPVVPAPIAAPVAPSMPVITVG
jgi:hypothetical protein